MSSTTTTTNATPLQQLPSQVNVSCSCTSSFFAEYSHISSDPYLKYDVTTERELSVERFAKVVFGCETWADLVKSTKVQEMSNDDSFKSLLQEYSDSAKETDLFPRFATLANHVLKKEGDEKTNPIRFHRYYHAPIFRLSAPCTPEIVITRDRVTDNTSNAPSGSKVGQCKKAPLSWMDILGYVEFKLECDRAEDEDEDEFATASKSSSRSESGSSSQSSSSGGRTSSSSNKRPRSDEWPESTHKRRRMRASDIEAKMRCAGYALEMLSSGGLRTHAFGLFIDKHDLRIQYFDRSVFLSSRSIQFTKDPCSLIALLYTLNGFSDRHWGNRPFFNRPVNYHLPRLRCKTRLSRHDSPSMGLTLGNGWKLRLSGVLAQQRVLIGRGTAVIRACTTEAPSFGENRVLAIKISSPVVSRKSERDTLQLAYSKATGKFEKMLDHLPKMYYNEDTDLTVDSPQGRLSAFFKDDKYELRVLRIMAFRELRPIYELVTADELSKALRDIFNCYRWLYEEARILHRDISLYNVMYYRNEDKIYGVLNDFDLATVVGNTSPASKQRTGTKPFMAAELLLRDGIPHFYRHDLESLFYVILILTSHFENGKEIENPPLQRWFSLDSRSLAEAKRTMLVLPVGYSLPPRTPPYASFEKWLDPIQRMFRKGMLDDRIFDETLGGNITFESLAAVFSIELSGDAAVS